MIILCVFRIFDTLIVRIEEDGIYFYLFCLFINQPTIHIKYSLQNNTPGWTFHIYWWNNVCVCVCVDVCLDVNKAGTNRNRCTHRLVIVHACTDLLMNPDRTPKPGQPDLLFESKIAKHLTPDPWEYCPQKLRKI